MNIIQRAVKAALDAVNNLVGTDIEAADLELTDDDVDPPKMSFEMSAIASTRNYILDSNLEDPQSLFRLLGLPPVSDEVLEMERRASDDRVDRIGILTPVLEAYAMTLSEVITANLAEAAGSDSLTDPAKALRWRMFANTMQSAMFAALVGSISQMVDKELIAVDPSLQVVYEIGD